MRIPDGTPAGGVAGTVSTTRLTTGTAALLRRRTAVDEDAFAPLGGHVGTFLVLPAVEVTGGYDTNPDRTPSGRPSAFVTVSPELLARSDWQRHEVTAALRGSYTAYDKTPDLDRPAVDGKVTGRFDVTRNTALIGEGILIVGTDNPGSPNVQAGLTRLPIFTTLGGVFGLTQRFNRVEVTAKGTAERTEYQPSQFTDGTTQSNADRDYNRFGGTLRTSYDLMPGLKPFVEFGADTREYDLQFDSSGLQRSSNGWFAKGGSAFEFSRKLTGEASIGWINRKYVDPSLQELNGFLFDAALIYSMSALTKVKLLATTVASETTVAGTSGVLTRNAGVEVEHSFRRWLIGAVRFNYGLDDYVGSLRKDNRYSVSARAHLQAQPHGAGQRRGPPGMAEVDRSRRRLCGLGVPARHAAAVLTHQVLQHRAKLLRDVGPRERVGDIGGKESELRAAVEGAALELEGVTRLRLEQTQDRVGHLDFAARAGLLVRQQVEDLRLQDVAPGDDQVRRRLGRLRLLHHGGDATRPALALADADHAIGRDLILRHFLDRDDVRGFASAPCRRRSSARGSLACPAPARRAATARTARVRPARARTRPRGRGRAATAGA